MLDRTCSELLKVKNLIAWLETKDPAKPYNWLSTSHCLITQYFRENGFPSATSGGWYSLPLEGDDLKVDWPEGFTVIARGDVMSFEKAMRSFNKGEHINQWTFGAALERAKRVSTGD